MGLNKAFLLIAILFCMVERSSNYVSRDIGDVNPVKFWYNLTEKMTVDCQFKIHILVFIP